MPTTTRRCAIGHGQTMSQPYMVALMTEQLGLRGPERVLEVGTGSGYHAAILSSLAREVYTIEIVPELAASARLRLTREGLPERPRQAGRRRARLARVRSLRRDRRHRRGADRPARAHRSAERGRRAGDAARRPERPSGAGARREAWRPSCAPGRSPRSASFRSPAAAPVALRHARRRTVGAHPKAPGRKMVASACGRGSATTEIARSGSSATTGHAGSVPWSRRARGRPRASSTRRSFRRSLAPRTRKSIDDLSGTNEPELLARQPLQIAVVGAELVQLRSQPFVVEQQARDSLLDPAFLRLQAPQVQHAAAAEQHRGDQRHRDRRRRGERESLPQDSETRGRLTHERGRYTTRRPQYKEKEPSREDQEDPRARDSRFARQPDGRGRRDARRRRVWTRRGAVRRVDRRARGGRAAGRESETLQREGRPAGGRQRQRRARAPVGGS